MRGDAEIQKYAVDMRTTRWFGATLTGDHLREVGEVGLDQRQARVDGGVGDGVGIPIYSDQGYVWKPIQEGKGVTPPAEGPVDNDAGCGGLHEVHYLAHHHRVVIGRAGLIHGQPPGTLAPPWKRAE